MKAPWELKKFDGSELETTIARAQTFMLLGVGIQWIGGMLQVYWILPFGYVMVIVYGSKLSAVTTHAWTRLLVVGLILPFLQWWCAYMLNEFATAFLLKRRKTVGLLGAYYPTWAAVLGFASVMCAAYFVNSAVQLGLKAR